MYAASASAQPEAYRTSVLTDEAAVAAAVPAVVESGRRLLVRTQSDSVCLEMSSVSIDRPPL